ncbi:four-carbon acid sugar kinase family protein [Comamonas sp. Tr-654]|uniref:3-oxo-tetronate kinase n=1 Tax=Comamonas sp. Tr-654 TaxID=2608341 RepID=UPI0014230CAD|nr:3-oxo-tetronate kinase [Comamonas sp. Tr-654]NIF82671.1 four-carbon acid sugar kinase family protein [Comamonas sp. Tr-654]
MSKLRLGCIADDFTGATDLANNLVRRGMRVVQTIGVPSSPLASDADAVVIALKSRTIPAEQAVEQSLKALQWLKEQDTQQTYFKYCSTFDSTPDGNIGPVIEALMQALDTEFTIACPAFPENGRTVFKGYLFVGDVLLHESGMSKHPLTPMTDSNLVRVLQAQMTGQVGLLDHTVVRQGLPFMRDSIQEMRQQGVKAAVVDAVDDADLLTIGLAVSDLKLITAGSGVAIGLPQNYGIQPDNQASALPTAIGRQAIVSGSCSVATNAQVTHFKQTGGASFAVDPLQLARGDDVVARAMAWASTCDPSSPLLFYATAEPEAVKAVQQQLGVAEAGHIVEKTLSEIARRLVEGGVGQLVVAGGETSGACVQALEITQMRIGPQIAPGVPWCHAHSPYALGKGVHVALKSGNFGSMDFFTHAFELLH